MKVKLYLAQWPSCLPGTQINLIPCWIRGSDLYDYGPIIFGLYSQCHVDIWIIGLLKVEVDRVTNSIELWYGIF